MAKIESQKTDVSVLEELAYQVRKDVYVPCLENQNVLDIAFSVEQYKHGIADNFVAAHNSIRLKKLEKGLGDIGKIITLGFFNVIFFELP